MGGTPKPPDPPDVIATRYAQAAQKAVTDIAQVAIDVFDKVNADPTTNPPKYKPKDAIASLSQLAGAVLSGGISVARVGLQVQWDRRILLVADNVASMVGQGLNETLDVAADVAKKAGPKPFKKQQQELVDAAIELTNIVALRGAEILETVVAGPGAYANPLLQRTFTIKDTLKRNRPATLAITELERTKDNVDFTPMATIDPPGFILGADKVTFTIAFNTAGLPSAAYQGVVTAKDTGAAPGPDRKFNISFAVPDTSDPPYP